jgi:hypothetical protein
MPFPFPFTTVSFGAGLAIMAQMVERALCRQLLEVQRVPDSPGRAETAVQV